MKKRKTNSHQKTILLDQQKNSNKKSKRENWRKRRNWLRKIKLRKWERENNSV